MALSGSEDLYVGCGYHVGQELKDCPCPKGEGAWLDYRAMWVAARQEAADLRGDVASLRKTNDTVAREARREAERERDVHRRTLNEIADALQVVHEDPKIVAEFYKLLELYRSHHRSLVAFRTWFDQLLAEGKEHPWQWVVTQGLSVLKFEIENAAALPVVEDPSDKQVVALALAELSLRRRGWAEACIAPIAQKIGCLYFYYQFRSIHRDSVTSFKQILEDIEEWINAGAYPSTTETGKVLRELAERLAKATDDLEAKPTWKPTRPSS